jgi:serine protease
MRTLGVLGLCATLGATLTVSASSARAEEFESERGASSDGELNQGWVLDLKDGVDPEALAAEYGIGLHDASPEIKDDANLATVLSLSSAMRARLLQDPRVEGLELITTVSAFFVPNDPKFSEQWHVSQVGAEKAWEYGCGRGVTVAVIDTGVACFDAGSFTKGSDLAGTRCVPGYNFVGNNKNAGDDHGHGTHVAGTIAQTTNNGLGVAGLAHCAKLMPVKVLSGSGSGTSVGVAEGIRFAADHGAQIMNLSLGSSAPSKVIEDAVKHAIKKGVLVVAAAGNSGRSVGYPAAYPGVVAVSATDKNDGLAWFSSRGPEVVIGAPGVAVVQQTVCNGGKDKCEVFGVFNGTSMASPHVAGIAAMVMGSGITDADAVREKLTSTAKPKSEKNHFGAGIVDAASAMRSTWMSHLMFRLIGLAAAFALVGALITKGRGKLQAGPATIFGALLAGVGLLPFAPLLGLETLSMSLRPLVEALARPLGEWPLMVNVALHPSTLLPALCLVLGYGFKSARPLIGGLALGTAAFAFQHAVQADVAFAMGSFALRLWMVLAVAISVGVARLTLDTKSS